MSPGRSARNARRAAAYRARRGEQQQQRDGGIVYSDEALRGLADAQKASRPRPGDGTRTARSNLAKGTSPSASPPSGS